MSYLLTSATDIVDLLEQVRDFALADGWTVHYDDIATNGRVGLELGANVKVAIERVSTTHTDAITSGTVTDVGFYANAVLAWTGANTRHFQHDTGGLITAYGDLDSIYCNDLTGTFPNVWMFSNAAKDCVHVVAQQGSSRFTHFGFGATETNGLTQPQCPYVYGEYWTFWPDAADYSNNSVGSAFNTPAALGAGGVHMIGQFAERYSSRCNMSVRIPTGLLNTAYGFTSSSIITPSGNLHPNNSRLDSIAAAISGGIFVNSLELDTFRAYDNDTTTGGVPLFKLPVFYRASNSLTAIRAYLGDIPNSRLVNISDLSAAQEITYASEAWVVFPMKQKGLYEETNFGASPQPINNSINYGFAYKKVV